MALTPKKIGTLRGVLVDHIEREGSDSSFSLRAGLLSDILDEVSATRLNSSPAAPVDAVYRKSDTPPIEQGDREAAADHFESAMAEGVPTAFAEAVRAGTEDDDPLVQAFARHRAPYAATTGAEGLVEQVDREAAADYTIELHQDVMLAKMMQEGRADHSMTVQAFARHRAQSSATIAALIEEVAEARIARRYVQEAGKILAPYSADPPGSPTRDALVQLNAALHKHARAALTQPAAEGGK